MKIEKISALACAGILVGGATLGLPGAAFADKSSEETVLSFFEEGEARAEELSQQSGALIRYLRAHFSASDFAWRTASAEVWTAADNMARLAYIDVVFCRLAQIGLAGTGEIATWRMLGSRDNGDLSTVGVLVTMEDGRERRLLFELRRSRQKIVDVRNEGGRLSQRLAQDFRREAGGLEPDANAAGWFDRITCDADAR